MQAVHAIAKALWRVGDLQPVYIGCGLRLQPAKSFGESGEDSVHLYFRAWTTVLETFFLVISSQCYNGFGGVSAARRRASIRTALESNSEGDNAAAGAGSTCLPEVRKVAPPEQ
jgi:hypothetical protein